MMEIPIDSILAIARNRTGKLACFRLLNDWCDYCAIYKACWNIWADEKPVAATCLMHVGQAVIEVNQAYPEAVLEFRPWQLHKEIRNDG